MVSISASALTSRNTRPALPRRLALAANCVSVPSTGLAMPSGHQALQEVLLQRALELGEHRKGREQRQHHREQRHQRDQRGEGQAAGGDAQVVFAEALAQRACSVEPGPSAQRLQQRRKLVGAHLPQAVAHRHAGYHASMVEPRSPATALGMDAIVRWSRCAGVGQPAGVDRAGPGLGAVARAHGQRHAGHQGAAAAAAAAGAVARAHVHLPLGQPAGVDLLRRRRRARYHRQGACRPCWPPSRCCCACCCSSPVRCTCAGACTARHARPRHERRLAARLASLCRRRPSAL